MINELLTWIVQEPYRFIIFLIIMISLLIFTMKVCGESLGNIIYEALEGEKYRRPHKK